MVAHCEMMRFPGSYFEGFPGTMLILTSWFRRCGFAKDEESSG